MTDLHTDRMDCQFIMGFFSYMYYQSFIATYAPVTVGDLLETAITSLTLDQQLEVVHGLQKYLVGQGVVNERVSSWIFFDFFFGL